MKLHPDVPTAVFVKGPGRRCWCFWTGFNSSYSCDLVDGRVGDIGAVHHLTFLKMVSKAWSQKSFCKPCWFVIFFPSWQWWSTSFYTMRFTTLILKKWCVCIFGSCLGHYSVRYNACTEKVGSFAYKKGECWWESVSCRRPCGYPWLLPSLPPFLSKDQTAEQDSDPPAEPSTTVAPVTW